MEKIILVGDEGDDLGGIADILLRHNDSFERCNTQIYEAGFADVISEIDTGVIVSRFSDGDLKSIKAMQLLRKKRPCLSFVFIIDSSIDFSIITLTFNEGAHGVISEPAQPEITRQLIHQAVKRSELDFGLIAIAKELQRVNESNVRRIESQEHQLSKANNLSDRLERLAYLLLSVKDFSPRDVRILFVSSSSYQRNTFTKLFEGLNFEVKSEENAEQALEIVKSFTPHIVISDLELPGMNGLKFASEIKENPGFPQVHFVIFTSNEGKVDYILSPQTRVDDCIIKSDDKGGVYKLVAQVALGLLN